MLIKIKKAQVYEDGNVRVLSNFFVSEEEWLDYELEQLRKYSTDYINGEDITASDLYSIREFV